MTRQQIIKAIGNPDLHLDSYAGYFVFRYDRPERFEEESVYVNRLNHMSLEQWIATGHNFLKTIGV